MLTSDKILIVFLIVMMILILFLAFKVLRQKITIRMLSNKEFEANERYIKESSKIQKVQNTIELFKSLENKDLRSLNEIDYNIPYFKSKESFFFIERSEVEKFSFLFNQIKAKDLDSIMFIKIDNKVYKIDPKFSDSILVNLLTTFLTIGNRKHIGGLKFE